MEIFPDENDRLRLRLIFRDFLLLYSNFYLFMCKLAIVVTDDNGGRTRLNV